MNGTYVILRLNATEVKMDKNVSDITQSHYVSEFCTVSCQ
jgi:hypothetical protein